MEKIIKHFTCELKMAAMKKFTTIESDEDIEICEESGDETIGEVS